MRKLLLLFILVSSMAYSQCPELVKNKSNPFEITLRSQQEIPMEDNIEINGIDFELIQTYFTDGYFYWVYDNLTKKPLSGHTGEDTCQFAQTLNLKTFKSIKSIPLDIEYNIYNIQGKRLFKGRTYENMYLQLPNNKILFVKLAGYHTKKIIL